MMSEATGNPNFKNSPIEALLNSTAIEDWSKELEKNLTNNNTLISENEATMAEYEKTMRDWQMRVCWKWSLVTPSKVRAYHYCG